MKLMVADMFSFESVWSDMTQQRLVLNKWWVTDRFLCQEPKDQSAEQCIEVVSVTEDDLPTVETPNTLIVSPLDSFVYDTEKNQSEKDKPEEPPPTAPSPSMPVTKVQPFLNGKSDVVKCKM